MKKRSTTHEIGTEEALAGAVEAEKRDERKVAKLASLLPKAEEHGAQSRRGAKHPGSRSASAHTASH